MGEGREGGGREGGSVQHKKREGETVINDHSTCTCNHGGCTDYIFLSHGGCTDLGCADSIFLSRR